MPDDPNDELKLAWEALSDADMMRQHGSDRGTIYRLYYACFHAAQAVLYDRGFDPTNHGAVIRWFGREVVVPGDASETDGRFLRELYTKRQEADYDQDPLVVNVDSLYSHSETFVKDMDELIDGNEE